jgi:putative hemolysin
VNAEAWLAIAVAALGIGLVLSCLVQSLRDLSRPTLEEIATLRGTPGDRLRVTRILEDVEGHAAAIALPRTLANIVFAAALVMWVAAARGTTSPGWAELLIAVALASLALWVFGLVLPNAVSKHAGEVMVFAWSRALRAAYIVCRPFARVAHAVDELVRRLSGRPRMSDEQAAQEELLEVVEEAESEGKVDPTEAEMIEAVVRLRDRTVREVMTPRTRIRAIEVSSDLSSLTAAIRRIPHSRIPVYEESLDRIVGIFYVKDLVKWLAGEGSRTGRTFDLRSACRPAYFVPETKSVRQALEEMLAKRTHVAIVADEYGGTAGLITIEDIVEEVFGEIADEYDAPQTSQPDVRVDVAAGLAELDAHLPIHEANDALAPLHAALPESEDYDTVGGFVTVTLGRIPAAGETFRHNGLKVTVLQAEPTRVTRVKVETASAGDDAQAPARRAAS